MKLTVENFGPIRNADVVIGPMTVFVGPSNTGKSYLATLVYAVLDALKHYYAVDLWQQIYGQKEAIAPEVRNVLEYLDTTRNAPDEWAQRFGTAIGQMFPIWANIASEKWKNSVVHCFGEEGKKMLDDDNLIVKISDMQNSFVLDLRAPANSTLHSEQKENILKGALSSTERLLARKHVAFLGAMQLSLLKTLKQIDSPDLKDIPEPLNLENVPDEFASHGLLTLLCYRFSLLPYMVRWETGNPQIQPHYLPASRGGIMQSHRALVQSALRGASEAGLSAAASIPSFTGIVSEFVSKLISLPDAQTRHDSDAAKMKIATIGKMMETEIMAGEIEAKMSETKYPDFRYNFQRSGKHYSVPLMSASSMVSELAPLSIFMRYYVAPGDLFIIEEPESHLHPGAQRDITNILVQLVNAGVRVLITTHSDTILEQLGNYVQAAEIGTEIGTKGQEQSLAKDKLSTYLFAQPKSGKQKTTKVKKVRFNPESGLLTKDHLDVSSALYNEVVSLLDGGES